MNPPHLCQPEYRHFDMREFYRAINAIPTSTVADTALIRSHIAYWSSTDQADRATIAPSRGHSYRVNKTVIVNITDHYDHRYGVTGWNTVGVFHQ